MAPSLEIRHLRMVAAIAETHAVTRAADRLDLTQSAVSHQLAELERRLGSPLFVRTGRRMVLTPAGARILEAARGILAELERTEAEVADLQHGTRSGLLRLATECYTCYHWLPKAVTRFREQWPNVEIRIVAEATRRPLAALAAAELDLAIVSSRSGAPLPEAVRRFATHRLFADEMVALVPPSHAWASRRHIEPEDFGVEHLILYSLRDDESTLFQEFLRPAGVRPLRASRIDLTEAILEMVKAGLGVTAMARWAAAQQIATGALVAVPLGRGGLHREWIAAYRPATGGGHFVRDFVEHLGRDVLPARDGEVVTTSSVHAPRARVPRGAVRARHTSRVPDRGR